jgi:hypothetical protein
VLLEVLPEGDEVDAAADAELGEDRRLVRVVAEGAEQVRRLRLHREPDVVVDVADVVLVLLLVRPRLGRSLVGRRKRRRGRVGPLVSEQVLPRGLARVADRADVREVVPPPAVEQNDAGRVERADERQRRDGVPELRLADVDLVEQPPDRDRRVVAVAEDQLAVIVAHPLRLLRRGAEAGGREALLVDHDSQLVGEIEQVPPRRGAVHADHVEAHLPGHHQPPLEQVGRGAVVVREPEPDRVEVALRDAAEVDPPAVQAERAVVEAEVAEADAESGRVDCGSGVTLKCQRRRDPVQVRRVEVPQGGVLDLELRRDERGARRQRHVERRLTQHLILHVP